MEKDKLAELLSKQPFLVVITDGRSNINRESIVNYVLWASGMRPMMWSSGTTGSNAHTGDYMASEILRVIADVEEMAGAGKVSAVVSDNAPNMKKAGRLVEEKLPNVIFNGCAAHAMNLLPKDIFKLDFFADVLKKAVKLVTFVRARHLLLDHVRGNRCLLPKTVKACELSAPVSTRWYAQEKCIKSVVRNKRPLKTAFSDSELMKHYTDKESMSKFSQVQSIVHGKQFWINAKIVIRLMKPITSALATLETDACSNSLVLHEFLQLYDAPEYTTEIITYPMNTLQDDIRKLIARRWDFIRPPSDSTTVANLMDPSKDIFALPDGRLDNRSADTYADRMYAENRDESVAGIGDENSNANSTESSGDGPIRKAVASAVKLAERFGLPPDVSPAKFRSVLVAFVKKKKNRTTTEREAASVDSPLDWWTLDSEFRILHKFAEIFFSIPTSSAASERLWSIQGFTHTKLRNRLRVATVEKLSFVYTNSGDTEPSRLPLYETPTRQIENYSDGEEDEDEDSLFDLRDVEFEYLQDAIVATDASSKGFRLPCQQRETTAYMGSLYAQHNVTPSASSDKGFELLHEEPDGM